MIHRNQPGRYPLVLRLLMACMYVWALYSGVAGLVWTPTTIEGFAGSVLTVVWAGLTILASVWALAGVVMNRYRWEWAAVWWVTAGVSVYVTTVWLLVFVAGTPTRQSQAAALTALVAMLLYRATELSAHAAKLRAQQQLEQALDLEIEAAQELRAEVRAVKKDAKSRRGKGSH